MADRTMRRKTDLSQMLTNREARVERLMAMMSAWWEGKTLREIGARHGISKQRVHVVLSRVNCRGRTRWPAGDCGFDCGRRWPAYLALEARAILTDPQSRRLTTLQRAAIAWGAAGLVPSDVARRMNRSVQVVRELQSAGRWRMMRLAWKNQPVWKPLSDTEFTFAPLEIEDIIGKPATDVK